MKVVNKLKEIRMKEFLSTQMEFAKILDLDYRQYNRYENGTEPKLSTALLIARKLNRSMAYLSIGGIAYSKITMGAKAFNELLLKVLKSI